MQQSHKYSGTRKPVLRTLHDWLFANQEKAVCIIGGESKALGFHQETTEESRNDKIGFV